MEAGKGQGGDTLGFSQGKVSRCLGKETALGPEAAPQPGSGGSSRGARRAGPSALPGDLLSSHGRGTRPRSSLPAMLSSSLCSPPLHPGPQGVVRGLSRTEFPGFLVLAPSCDAQICLPCSRLHSLQHTTPAVSGVPRIQPAQSNSALPLWWGRLPQGLGSPASASDLGNRHL